MASSLLQLFQTASKRTLTTEERDALRMMLAGETENEIIDMIASGMSATENPYEKSREYITGLVESIFSAEPVNTVPAAMQKPVHRIHFIKTVWFRYAAAIIVCAGIGAYLWNKNSTTDKRTASWRA